MLRRERARWDAWYSGNGAAMTVMQKLLCNQQREHHIAAWIGGYMESCNARQQLAHLEIPVGEVQVELSEVHC